MPTLQAHTLIQAGDIAPFYIGITHAGKLYSFESQAGRPAVLLLLGSLGTTASTAFLRTFECYRERFGMFDADIVAFTTDTPWNALDYTMAHPTAITIACEAQSFMTACGLAEPPPAVLVMDANRVVLSHASACLPEEAMASALACLAAQPRETARDVVLQAPVLLLRNVISRTFCRELIALFANGGHFDSGFMSIDDAGKPVLVIDHVVKRRADHFIQPDHSMNEKLMDVVIRRIAPEIKRAFHVDIAHCERFLISRYDDSGGHFSRHRDDTGTANAHRQFAVTLNLNTEDYDGGQLIFPEYGPHRYRPGTGDAAIFSGSMLHAALPVTRGTRYTLLGFLHSSEADTRRQAYLENTDA